MATKTVTPQGNAQIDTAQSKFGGASGLFDGTGDYLTIPDDTDFSFGSGAWTIDFWFRANATGIWQQCYQQYDASNDFFAIEVGATNKLYVQYISSGSWQVDFSIPFTPSTGVWYHIEVGRNGNTASDWYAFIDGTNGTKTTTTGTFNATIKDFTSVVTIGQKSSGDYVNGWIDEFRVSKGVCRHTANFTPETSAYTTDANTVLLLHMDGVDASTTFTDSSVVAGPANLKSYNTILKANIKSINTIPIANLKSWNTIT